MTSYDTKAKTIGDITVTVSKAKGTTAGDKLVAFLEWLSTALTKPDQGLPGSPGAPDQSLPGSPAAPDQGLPSQPGGKPGHLPAHGRPPHVDNDLPGFLGEHAKEIAKIILKDTLCDVDKPQPKSI